MSCLQVKLSGRDASYPIHLEPGGRRRLAVYLRQQGLTGPVWLVTDTLVQRLYGAEVLTGLAREGFAAQMLVVPRGERSKSWPVAARLLQQLLDQGADRQRLPWWLWGAGSSAI